MFTSTLFFGAAVGLVHFFVVGLLYGNPLVDRVYQEAMQREPGVRRWPSRARYLVVQFLGTQLEVWALSFAFFWVRSSQGVSTLGASLTIGLVFSALRVYPRFWNMFIQSTYPRRLLAIEAVNGVLSTFTVVLGLHFMAS